MPLLYLVLTLTVVALIAWFVNTTPMAEGIKSRFWLSAWIEIAFSVHPGHLIT